MSVRNNYKFELELEKRLRKKKWLIPTFGILMSIVLITLVWMSLFLFNKGYWWVIFPAGLLAHSFFVIALHDAAHKAITRTKADRWILNSASGLLILPFFGEVFRNSHLIHHAHSNSENDPLWHENKEFLFKKNRLFYVLCELVPLLFHGFLFLRSRKLQKQRKIKGPGINLWFVLFATSISVALILVLKPSIWFVLGMIVSLNIFGKLRHWCEHIGTDVNGSNNTFWFPLGLGVGNHDTHHYAPFVSWLALSIGLVKRKKNSNPIYAVYGVLFRKEFRHYSEEGNMVGKDK
jgi:fatty acid desaturase